MQPTYRLIDVERLGDACSVRLRDRRISEDRIHELADELLEASSSGCQTLALSLGPQPPECLYSIFLSKLVTVQRALAERGAKLVLCEVRPEVKAIFEACRLDTQFRFAVDFEAARAMSSG
jgi:hypothetical protein